MTTSLLSVMIQLHTISKQSYVVGGCVRDMIIGKEPNDFDIVTDIPYDNLITIFTESGWEINETGKDFLVLRISKMFPVERYNEFFKLHYYELERVEYEIANFRTDGVSFTDGRRPDKVDIGDIVTDANRRDFTINAIYMDLFTGTMIDPTGNGIEDCESRILRFIGNAKQRIAEDKLRVFRAYRFIAKGFVPTKQTLKVIRECYNDAYMSTTPERVRLEIEKMVGVI